jgi:hypothetical protein
MFVAKASGALFDLGLDVKRLSPEAKERYFIEGHAIYEATRKRPPEQRYNPKRFAMRFFVWYGLEYKRTDTQAFVREGVLADSIAIMRQWARREPELADVVEREVKLVFETLYRATERMTDPKEVVLAAQLELLRIMKDTAPQRS